MSLKRAAIARLKFYDKQFEELLAILDGSTLSSEQQMEAQRRLKRLKNGLRDEANALEERDEQLNRFEAHFVEPALRKAAASITTQPNTKPDERWRQNLSTVRIDLAWALHELEQA